MLQQQVFGDERLLQVTSRLRRSQTQGECIEALRPLYADRDAESFFEVLRSNGYLISNPVDVVTEFIPSEATQRHRGYRLLRILLTDVCNLDCAYCKVMPNIVDVTKRATSFDNLDRVVRIFFEGSITAKPKIIHISGGEPLIAWEHVQHIIDLVEQYRRSGERYYIVIGTNAMLVNEERAAYLAAHSVKVIASMDGRETVHDTLRRDFNDGGSFARVDKGVRLLKKYGIELGLSMVVGRHNVGTLVEEIGFMIEQYGPVSLGVNYMKPPTKEQTDFPYLISPDEYVTSMYRAFQTYRHTGLFFELVYRKIHPFVTRGFRYHDCGAAAGTTINIDAKGHVGPCKSFLVLNTLSDGLDSIDRSKSDPFPIIGQQACGGCSSGSCGTKSPSQFSLPVLDSLQKRSPVYIDECQTCAAIATCGNACAYEAWVQSGDPLSRDMRACNYTQLFYSHFIEDLASVVRPSVAGQPFYVPTKEDRQKLFGKIVVNEDTLSSSIGHAADE